jgi:hypothetical protein
MEGNKEELGKARTAVGASGGAAGEGQREELDAIDIEILLTSGHFDDCCHS